MHSQATRNSLDDLEQFRRWALYQVLFWAFCCMGVLACACLQGGWMYLLLVPSAYLLSVSHEKFAEFNSQVEHARQFTGFRIEDDYPPAP